MDALDLPFGHCTNPCGGSSACASTTFSHYAHLLKQIVEQDEAHHNHHHDSLLWSGVHFLYLLNLQNPQTNWKSCLQISIQCCCKFFPRWVLGLLSPKIQAMASLPLRVDESQAKFFG